MRENTQTFKPTHNLTEITFNYGCGPKLKADDGLRRRVKAVEYTHGYRSFSSAEEAEQAKEDLEKEKKLIKEDSPI